MDRWEPAGGKAWDQPEDFANEQKLIWAINPPAADQLKTPKTKPMKLFLPTDPGQPECL